MNGTIYKMTDKNNRIYVGATMRNLQTRMSEHKSHALSGYSDGLLHKAIREHGWESFEVEAIDTASNREELFELEAQWIEKLRANKDGNYNASSGYGNSGNTGTANHKGEKNPNARLSEKEAIQIKILLMGDLNQFQIAEMYSVSHKTISHINCGRLWSSVNVITVA